MRGAGLLFRSAHSPTVVGVILKDRQSLVQWRAAAVHEPTQLGLQTGGDSGWHFEIGLTRWLPAHD